MSRVSKSAVDILNELDVLMVKAAAAADEDKSRVSSSHPTATAENQTQNVPTGSRAAENSTDTKETVGGPMAVDSTSPGPSANTGEGSPMNRLGMNPKATGEAPEVENDIKDKKEDPGVRGKKPTSSPAKVGDEKYGSLHAKGLSLLNDINSALGIEIQKQAAGPGVANNSTETTTKPTASASTESIKMKPVGKKGKAVGAPEATSAAPVDAGEAEAQKAAEVEAGAQAAADAVELTKEAQEEMTIKVAQVIAIDGIALGEKLAEFLEGFQQGVQKSAEGIPPELAQDLAAGPAGGAGGADPTGGASQMMPPAAMAGGAGPDAGGPGGPGGQQISPEMLAQLLQEAGVTPEELAQIEQALAAQQGGGEAPEAGGGAPAPEAVAAQKDNETSSEDGEHESEETPEKEAKEEAAAKEAFVKQFKKLVVKAAGLNQRKVSKK